MTSQNELCFFLNEFFQANLFRKIPPIPSTLTLTSFPVQTNVELFLMAGSLVVRVVINQPLSDTGASHPARAGSGIHQSHGTLNRLRLSIRLLLKQLIRE